GAQFDVVRAGTQTGMPDSFANRTIAGADVRLATTCDGVLDLRAIGAAEPIRVIPPFDPRITSYPTAKTPWLLDPTQPFGVVAMPQYAAPTTIVLAPAAPTPAATITVAIAHP